MVTTEVTDGCRARLVDGRYWRSLHLLITQESGEETCDAFNGYKSTYTDLNTAELNWAELSWGGIINYSSDLLQMLGKHVTIFRRGQRVKQPNPQNFPKLLAKTFHLPVDVQTMLLS